jgi:hypothetical protein
MAVQKHYFTKNVVDAVLADMVMLNDTLRPVVLGITVNRNMDGTTPENNVVVECSRGLFSEEYDKLVAIVNNYDTHRFVRRYAIKQAYVNPSMSFGMDFLADYSANNVEREKTQEQIFAMMSAYPLVPILCMTGAMESLYGLMLTMEAGPFITQEEINEFQKRLAIYLGVA